MDVNSVPIIITGGASGLGAATGSVFAAAGARVALFDIDTEAGMRAANGMGGRFFKVDVTSEASVSAGLTQAAEALGCARVLINCAGIGLGAATASRHGPHSLELFRELVEVNLTGTFNCISKFAARLLMQPRIAPAECGVIINTASIAAFEGQAGQAAYAASKAAIVGMTLPIARDLAPAGIRVVTIAPGIFRTPMLNQTPASATGRLLEQVLFPKRPGEPTEYAHLARTIVETPMINATTIRLDAGLRMSNS